jgi:hypothetical protein
MTTEARYRRLIHRALLDAGRPATATELSRALPSGLAHPRRIALHCLDELIVAGLVRSTVLPRPDGSGVLIYALLAAREEAIPR